MEKEINPTLATCAFIYDHAGGLLSATVITWENEEDGIQFHRQEFASKKSTAEEMFKTLSNKKGIGWLMTRTGRVRAFVTPFTNARLGTLYAYLEDLEKQFFSEHPEGIAIKINPKGPRS
ncbi:hypothetical protein ACQCP7_25775 [Ralstonia pseudosolanacearum]|uniref:hypothetical protein n=1 Tax=Ralstonia pseudosolanacearum TaxID=1310165 RepID=UPI003CF52F0B